MRDASLHPDDIAHLLAWVGAVNQAAKTGLDVEDPFRVAALGMRESDFGYAPGYTPQGDPCGWGDHGNAFGFFQFDRRYHADWIASDEAKTVAGQAQLACSLLAQNRHWLRNTIRDPVLLEACAYAAYNAGVRSVLGAVRLSNPPDSVTTGRDYSQWIFAKADALRLAVPTLFDTWKDGLIC